MTHFRLSTSHLMLLTCRRKIVQIQITKFRFLTNKHSPWFFKNKNFPWRSRYSSAILLLTALLFFFFFFLSQLAKIFLQMKALPAEAIKCTKKDRHLSVNLETAKRKLVDAEKEVKWLRYAPSSSKKEYEQFSRILTMFRLIWTMKEGFPTF